MSINIYDKYLYLQIFFQLRKKFKLLFCKELHFLPEKIIISKDLGGYTLYQEPSNFDRINIYIHFKNYYFHLSFRFESFEIKAYSLSKEANKNFIEDCQKQKRVIELHKETGLDFNASHVLMLHEINSYQCLNENPPERKKSILMNDDKEKYLLLKFIDFIISEHYNTLISIKTEEPSFSKKESYFEALEDF